MGRERNRRDSEGGVQEGALRDILLLERQVQEIIDEAEMEAKEMVRSAQEQAEALRVRSKREAKEQAEQNWEQAIHGIAEDAKVQLDEAEREAEQWADEARKRLDRAVAYVLQVVMLQDGDRNP